MTNTEKELIWKRNENLRLMKEEININNRLKRKIIEGNINEDDLIISRKFSELLKRNLEMKSVRFYNTVFFVSYSKNIKY